MLAYPSLTQKKCSFYKIRSVVCRGYHPPEYIMHQILSKKFDIFSLGIVIMKVLLGSNGFGRFADMPSDEFIDLVRNAVSCIGMHDRRAFLLLVQRDFSGT